MTIFKMAAILLVLFSGFGLISCSQEKEVIYQADTYNPQDIVLQQADRSILDLNDLANLDFSHTLLVNSGANDKNNRIETLDITAKCRSEASTSTYSQSIKKLQPSTIPILEILPPETLLDSSGRPVYCDFSMSSTNFLGSTNTQIVNSVKITNLDSFSNLSENHLFSSPSIVWSAVLKQDVGIDQPMLMTLSCSDFSWTQKDVMVGTPLESFLTPDFMSQLTFKSSSQKCRALFKTKDTTVVSRVFQMEIPIKNPIIKMAARGNGSNFDPQTVFVYTIENPNSFPVSINIDTYDRSIQFYAISQRSASGFRSQKQSLPLTWILNDELTLPSATPGGILHVLTPNATMTLKATYTFDGKCSYVGSSYSIIKTQWLGLNFDINNDVGFNLIQNQQDPLSVPANVISKTYPSPRGLRFWDVHFATFFPHKFTSIEQLISSTRWDEETKDCF
jgi:hypothetical protein